LIGFVICQGKLFNQYKGGDSMESNLDVAIFIERFIYRNGLSAGSTTVTELVEALMKEEEDED
jgi:hypothetical protein